MYLNLKNNLKNNNVKLFLKFARHPPWLKSCVLSIPWEGLNSGCWMFYTREDDSNSNVNLALLLHSHTNTEGRWSPSRTLYRYTSPQITGCSHATTTFTCLQLFSYGITLMIIDHQLHVSLGLYRGKNNLVTLPLFQVGTWTFWIFHTKKVTY